MQVEHHPLKPFLPSSTRLLMLGSFPPARHRWSMDFFYPNFINDMWRIFGICFHDDKIYFVDEENKTFRKSLIIELLEAKGIGLYDTATEVIRLKNTASDKDLEVVQPTDIHALLQQIPLCTSIVTTGQKATELLCSFFGVEVPKIGSFAETTYEGKVMHLYRMPSSSRAYPMKVEKKAEFYKQMFMAEGLI
ncbi:MAG: uracil-DNA glycosylase family protein [Prevotella sp.]|nr:uracil-DNA glycosylase family protein [Prevotella sp.]